MDIIDAKDLTKRFGALEAVKGVTFSVMEGEVFGFLGPNGAGKTTTINMLCTLLRPTSGAAIINGFDVVTQRSNVRRSIGLVFQESTLDTYLTAEQNLRFHAYAYGVPRGERDKRIQEVMELVGLWDRRDNKVQTYSGGMRRRLEIARGLVHHPRVLFLDEPTLGLDPQTRRSVWDHVMELRQREHLSIFLTTHYMEEAENCDRIAVIDQGKIIALDTPSRLKDAVGGDVVTFSAQENERAAAEVKERFGLVPEVRDGSVRFSVAQGDRFLPEFIRTLSVPLQSISLHRPTLEDVFLSLTGRAIREESGNGEMDMMRMRMRAGMRH